MPDAVDECGCKVGRSARAYGIDDLDADVLERREESEASLRDLAAYVNTRIVEKAVEETNQPIAADPKSIRAALVDDDVSPDREAFIRNLLVDAGIDVTDLTADFVSYQVVRTHLQDCLGTDTGRRGITTVSECRETITTTLDRSSRVIEQTLRRLHNVDELAATDVSVTLSVRVRCDDCGEYYTVEDYLETGGCHCMSH